MWMCVLLTWTGQVCWQLAWIEDVFVGTGSSLTWYTGCASPGDACEHSRAGAVCCAIQSEAAGISATVQLALVDAEWVDHRSLVWVASHGSAGCGAAKVT